MVGRAVRGPTPSAASPPDNGPAGVSSGSSARPAGRARQLGSLPEQPDSDGEPTRGRSRTRKGSRPPGGTGPPDG
eukprot:5468151-Alexandrium_andersonii.AAC.1